MKRTVVGLGVSALAYIVETLTTSDDFVEVFEAGSTIADRLPVSGNGRCNICNRSMFTSADSYYQSSSQLPNPLFTSSDERLLFALLKKIGLDCYEEQAGRIYPFSNSAKTVESLFTRLLTSCSDRLKIHYGCPIARLDFENSCAVGSDGAFHPFQTLFCAVGGRSYGRDKIAPLVMPGLRTEKCRPALGAFEPTFTWPKKLTGTRLKALLSLYRGSQLLFQEDGELLFRERRLSGIAAFDASLFFAGELADYMCCLDLGYHDGQRAQSEDPTAYLPPKLAECLGELPCYGRELRFGIKSAPAWNEAQVTAGGVKLTELDLKNMALLSWPAVRLGGEMLDLTGVCGGFNIGWALVSGLRAAHN